MLDALCKFVDLQPAVVVAIVGGKHLAERLSSRFYCLLHRGEHPSSMDGLKLLLNLTHI